MYYMCLTGVLHMYYRCMNYAWIHQNRPYMYHICNIHVAHFFTVERTSKTTLRLELTCNIIHTCIDGGQDGGGGGGMVVNL